MRINIGLYAGIVVASALGIVALGCKRSVASDAGDAAAAASSSPGTSAIAATPAAVGGRTPFVFIDAPTVADAGNAPLACVLDGLRFDARGVAFRAYHDDWRNWRLEISNLPLEKGGYVADGAAEIDLYLPEKNPSPGHPLLFAKQRSSAGSEHPAQAIVRWNDLFGVGKAKDDHGRNANTNTLGDGQSYAIAFDEFRPATKGKPGQASGRLYLAMRPTSPGESERLPHFRDPCGCQGTFTNAPVY